MELLFGRSSEVSQPGEVVGIKEEKLFDSHFEPEGIAHRGCSILSCFCTEGPDDVGMYGFVITPADCADYVL